MKGLTVREDDLRGHAVQRLLREHLDHMHRITPPGSVHALDIEGLRSRDITFWSAWLGPELVGCAALKDLGGESGEIKSMRTVAEHRGKGVASRLLKHLVAEAGRRGYSALFLETGAFPAFGPARALYRRHGFALCGAFGDYRDDGKSVFMRLALT